MHRPFPSRLRPDRVPRRWRTLLAAAVVVTAVQAVAMIPAQAGRPRRRRPVRRR